MEPGKTFGVDFLGCVRYLAAADRDRSGPEAASPAFDAMIEAFPLRRAAGFLDWTDLFYLARGYWTRIEGIADRHVGPQLFERIRRGPVAPLPRREEGPSIARKAGGGWSSGFGLGKPAVSWQAVELFDVDPLRGGTTVHVFADGDGWFQVVAPTGNCRIWRGRVSGRRLAEIDGLLQEVDLHTLQASIETGPLVPGERVARILLTASAGEVTVSMSSRSTHADFQRWVDLLAGTGQAISREPGKPWDNRADPTWRPLPPKS